MDPSVSAVASANEEAVGAWNGVLFDRFEAFRDIVVTGIAEHGERALRMHPPLAGERVLDLGCGFGDSTQRIGEMVGDEGEAVGIDAAERFIEAASAEAARSGARNVRFAVGDVQVADLGEGFDYAYSRMGMMFFANPVAALRNVRRALRPGGRLCMVVWRRKLDNEWLHRAELAVEPYLDRNEDSDELTCGPGPFSMADADTVSTQLLAAGFEDVALVRSDSDLRIGADLDEAVELVMALGPAGEVIRLAGEEADRIRPELAAAIRETLEEFEGEHGVRAPASTWIVSARAPAPRG
jgi:ubiquinone/menaquinone biosynthesis C-methylase UbiE